MRAPLALCLFAAGCVTGVDGAADSAGGDDGGATGDGGASAIETLDPTALPAGDDPCRPPELVTVDWVVDGDTMYVDTSSGDEKVRIIGVDTPEIGYEGEPDDCYGAEARDFTTDALEGEQVWLSFDGECVDAYGRTLAYVSTGLSEQDFFERQLLRGGWARTMSIAPNTSYQSVFEADEDKARSDDEGGWAACGW
jgi:micrococcal nuclease